MTYKIAATIGILTIALGLAALSRPATAACIFAFENELTESQAEIILSAKARIRSRFGPLESQPVVYFFDAPDSYWPLALNSYGSTSYLGYKTCVAIGPNGQNVDVVAHELMHAETASHTGFWARSKKLPIWFDEGLAMQVDFRERYNLRKGADFSFVTHLKSSRAFFVSDRELLTEHYAAAKAAVKLTLSGESESDVYSQLKQLREGRTFDSIWRVTD